MKNKINLLLVLAIAFAIALVSSVSAQETTVAKSDKVGETNTTTVQGNKTGNAVQIGEQNKVKNQGETTQIQTQEQNTVQTKDSTKDKNKKNEEQFNGESHRSTVATFVQSLLTVADREGGIGQEVRIIAQQQNDMKGRTSDLINAVENRNKIKTFFIGTSYKNLGELRIQMVNSRNQIEQLNRLADKAENDQDKTELKSQIQVLEQEQTKINDFITQNESKFSLFGWAVKLLQ